jgi:hypothetical protein
MGAIVKTDGPAESCCRITLYDAMGTAAECEACGQRWESGTDEWCLVSDPKANGSED